MITHNINLAGRLLLVALVGFSDPAQAFLSDPLGANGHNPAAPRLSCDEEAPPPAEIDLADAINLGLCRNPDLRGAWANAGISAAALGQARSAYLPTVGLDTDASRFYSRGGRSASGVSFSGGNTTVTPELTVSYLLYDFGGREATVESAKQQLLAAGWTYNSQMQNFVLQVIRAYTGLLTASESLGAAKASEAASQRAFDVAKGRLDVGAVTPADTALTETAFSESTLARQQAENNLKVAQGTFAALLRLPMTSEWAVKPIDPEQLDNPYQQDVDALLKKAIAERPDLAAARASEEQANAEISRTRALNYPSLSLAATTGHTDYTGGDATREAGTLGLRLTIPIFTGFSNSYQIESAKRSYEVASARRKSAEDQAMLDAWTAYHNFDTARQTYTTAQTLLKSAELSEQLSVGRYQAGTGTLTEALEAQAKLASARQQWVSARYNILVTRSDLARALGDIPQAPAPTQIAPPAEPVATPIVEPAPPPAAEPTPAPVAEPIEAPTLPWAVAEPEPAPPPAPIAQPQPGIVTPIDPDPKKKR